MTPKHPAPPQLPTHRQAWQQSILLKYGQRILQRVIALREQLAALPRPTRRKLKTATGMGLTSLALALALAGSPTPAHAATINVDGTTCTLAEAITTANNGSLQAGCTQGDGSGPDTLNITADIALTTALPDITSEMTIEGNGHTISRSSGNIRILKLVTGGDLTLNNATISGGNITGSSFRTHSGGGIYASYASLTVNNSTITQNSAETGGGGIFVYATNLVINNSTISNNQGGSIGGGIFSNGTIPDPSNVTINNSALIDNSAGSGAGIRLADSTVTGNNSTVSGNTATNGSIGGGGFFVDSGGTLRLNNSTITGNSTPGRGGGIYLYNDNTSLTLSRSLVSGNSANNGAELYVYASGSKYAEVVADNYNVVGYGGSNRSTNLTTLGGSDVVPTGALNTVLNTTLANNGGSTLTHALVAGSPAIDIAPAGNCAGAPINGVDQRGVSRSQDGDTDGTAVCDAGAVEHIPQVCTISPSTPYNFGGVVINFDDLASTNLDCVRVEYVDGNHPNATSSMSNAALETGRYWRLSGLQADGTTPATGTFQADITLPYTGADANSRACKWLDGSGAGFGWDCGTDADNTEGVNTVTRDNYTGGFSDWAVGDQVGPTAVTNLQPQTSEPANRGTLATLLAAITLTFGTAWAAVRTRRKQA